MRLDEAAIVIRPRSAASVCDLAFRFVFGLRPTLFAKLTALFILPGAALVGLLRYILGWDWFPIWLCSFAYATVFQGMFTVAAGQLMFEREVELRGVLRDYRQHLWGHLLPALITRVVVVLTSLFFALGLLLWVRYMYVHEAALLEGKSGTQATERAASFVSNHFGDAFTVLLLVCCVSGAFVVGFETLGRGVVEFLFMLPSLAEPITDTGGSPYALLGFFASVPFTATLRFLSYIDGRTRRDGWDIQVTFMGIEAQPRGGAA